MGLLNGLTTKDLYVVTQENLGGAGGFHTGIKTAFEKDLIGYGVWMMIR